jgi:site-specific DNA-cytosine methylase
VVGLLAPRAIIIEQTEGLQTHCALAYAEYLTLWDGLGYRVYHSLVDAHDTCGASHHRSRLIWVAVREGL